MPASTPDGPCSYLKTRSDLLRHAVPAEASIAEVGVFKGEFSREIMEICRPRALWLIDIWEGSTASGDKDGMNIQRVEDMEREYRRLLALYRDDPAVHLCRGRSTDELAKLRDASLDAIYIDSSHSYTETLAELALAWDKVRSGGAILGHDFNTDGVSRAVGEFCRAKAVGLEWLTEDGCPSFGFRPV